MEGAGIEIVRAGEMRTHAPQFVALRRFDAHDLVAQFNQQPRAIGPDRTGKVEDQSHYAAASPMKASIARSSMPSQSRRISRPCWPMRGATCGATLWLPWNTAGEPTVRSP